ncbi:hypothetical protein JW962_01505 [Candidatus Dojkabacteria bacterium]|nr:hypothetical protein [Candidatus Dojkabacteria bacterium]
MSKFTALINRIQASRVSVIFILAGQIIMILVMIVSAMQLEGLFKAIVVLDTRLVTLEDKVNISGSDENLLQRITTLESISNKLASDVSVLKGTENMSRSIIDGHFVTESGVVYLIIDKFHEENFHAWLETVSGVNNSNRLPIGCLEEGEFDTSVLIDETVENFVLTGTTTQKRLVILYPYLPNMEAGSCVNSVIGAVYVW